MTNPQFTADSLLYDHVAVLSLMTHSAVHRFWSPRAVLEWILPPMGLGQYLLVRADNRPVAFASWAFASDIAHEKLRAGEPLSVIQWQSGPHIWIVDFIAPFGHCRQVVQHLRHVLAAGGLDGKKAHWIRRHIAGQRG